MRLQGDNLPVAFDASGANMASEPGETGAAAGGVPRTRGRS
jgi:hypothetical protein